MNRSQLRIFNIEGYSTKLLNDSDVPVVQEFLEQCNDFFELVEGRTVNPSAGNSIFVDRPPDKPEEDKYVIGIYDQPGSLIGLIDLVVDYPVEGEWFIGLFMLVPKHRKCGLGRKIYRAFEEWAYQYGAMSIGLGVVEQNKAACHFWEQMGFTLIAKRPPKRFGNKENIVLVMRHTLPTSKPG